MTTRVTVEASSHDVEVYTLDRKGTPINEQADVVKKGDSRTFYAHSQQDILVKEIADG